MNCIQYPEFVGVLVHGKVVVEFRPKGECTAKMLIKYRPKEYYIVEDEVSLSNIAEEVDIVVCAPCTPNELAEVLLATGGTVPVYAELDKAEMMRAVNICRTAKNKWKIYCKIQAQGNAVVVTVNPKNNES